MIVNRVSMKMESERISRIIKNLRSCIEKRNEMKAGINI